MALIQSDRDQVIGKLSRLAIDFAGSDKSLAQLVRDSGVGALKPAISANDFLVYLRQNTSLVDTWLHWSEDKRVSSGPYFRKDDDAFEVGMLQSDGTCSNLGWFDDPAEACAMFLQHELIESSAAT